MVSKPSGTGRPRTGRPPSGPAGEHVSAYPRLTVRLPRATKDALTGLSALRRQPAWKIIDAAVLAYVNALPADVRRALAQFTKNMDRE